MGRLLNKIKEPNDIKRISPKLYPILAQEIRFPHRSCQSDWRASCLEFGSSGNYNGSAYLSSFSRR